MRSVLVGLAADPPLDPSPSEARELLLRELARPEYHQRSLVDQLVDWIGRLLDGRDPTHAPSGVATFAAILVSLALALAVGWLLSRARRTARARREEGAVLPVETVTAAELRARAERALAEGRAGDAVVDGFRALAVRQVERGRLDDRPGATAHEVALALAGAYPDQQGRVAGSAALFDAVHYGHRTASAAQAAEVLGLDDALADRR